MAYVVVPRLARGCEGGARSRSASRGSTERAEGDREGSRELAPLVRPGAGDCWKATRPGNRARTCAQSAQPTDRRAEGGHRPGASSGCATVIFGRDPLANPEPLIRRVYSYVAYRLGDGPDAEDVTSDVFERALRYRESYDRQKG